MTVKELLKSLNNWIEDGITKETDNIYVCFGNLPTNEVDIYKATFCGGNDPEYDSKDPAKQAIYFGILKQVPNTWSKENNYKEYGVGNDTISFDCEMDEDNVNVLVAQKKIEFWKKQLEYYQKNIEEKKNPKKFKQEEFDI